MQKFIKYGRAVTLKLNYFDLLWTCTSCFYTVNQQFTNFDWHITSRGPSAVAELMWLTAGLQSMINWTVVGQLSWQYRRRSTASLSQWSSSSVYSTISSCGSISDGMKAELSAIFYYSGPDRGAEYCDDRVCVFVCPWSYLRNYTSDLHQFICMLPVAVARSSSGGVVIRYVLTVYGWHHILEIDLTTDSYLTAFLE